MKTLTLMRHAKSDWANPSLGDAERPLNARGEKAATRMGQFLKENDLTPDLILCSAATRTKQTLELISPHLDPVPPVLFRTSLYLASPDEMLKQIKAAKDEYRHLLVLAHNPGLEMLAMTLTNTEQSNQQALAKISEKFPTCALAHFQFDISSWNALAPRCGLLKISATPRTL